MQRDDDGEESEKYVQNPSLSIQGKKGEGYEDIKENVSSNFDSESMACGRVEAAKATKNS